MKQSCWDRKAEQVMYRLCWAQLCRTSQCALGLPQSRELKGGAWWPDPQLRSHEYFLFPFLENFNTLFERIAQILCRLPRR